MCIRDTFAVSYNERAIFLWAQQQLLRSKPAYARMVPRKWHQSKAGMELFHFLLALLILLWGKAILASTTINNNASKLKQHHPLPRTTMLPCPRDQTNRGIWWWKWRSLGKLANYPCEQLVSPTPNSYMLSKTNVLISDTCCVSVKVAFKAVKIKGLYGHGHVVVPLRLLQTFAGVLQKKIRTRAVFKETPTNRKVIKCTIR